MLREFKGITLNENEIANSRRQKANENSDGIGIFGVNL